MLHLFLKEGDWFAPKRFGYGASWPIAWQGWVLLAVYLAAVGGSVMLAKDGHAGGHIAALALILLLTGLFMAVAARRTRGGWKWRWGYKTQDAPSRTPANRPRHAHRAKSPDAEERAVPVRHSKLRDYLWLGCYFLALGTIALLDGMRQPFVEAHFWALMAALHVLAFALSPARRGIARRH
ncbi:hypothetical protein [Novosphingobium beihaiensis]|uniref:DUF4175 domain-containing protein n=1 Tax=Novosphingobium beihaiensis TaxID=2930389 RepID=A0ABT0BSG6_9SPHN|nr:hypothetical protein [Novosphingobium beihaiensis]MCJ2187987.1 hypothetical protein [Novosphingobium beihaiensis]